MATVIDERAKDFWQFYKTCVGGMYEIPRSGYGMYGSYPYRREFDKNRSVSDLEHVCAVEYLIYAFSEFYPEFISEHEYSKFTKWALGHELGEIETGDIPDDGTRDEKKKDCIERKKLKEIFEKTPQRMREEANEVFCEFQDKVTVFSRKAYSLDKFAAVLGGFLLESQGRGGDYSMKLNTYGLDNPSSRDILNAEITQSHRLVDMWSCDFILRARKYFFQYLDMFIEIIQAAATDVFDKELDWIEKALNYDISSSHY